MLLRCLLAVGAYGLVVPMRRRQVRGFPLRMAETLPITMPALSSTMQSGRVVTWLKQVGDKISAGDPIIVVESDKADMEVESYEDGFLAQVVVGEGEDAQVGATIGVLAQTLDDLVVIQQGGGGSLAAPVAESTTQGTPVTMPALSSTMTTGRIVSWLKQVGDKVSAGDPVMVVESDKADMEVESYDEGYVAAILVEEGTEAAVGAPVALLAENAEDIESVAAAGSPTSAPAAAAAAPAVAAPAVPQTPAASGERVAASGYARKLAAEAGVDVGSLAGSGPGGRVVARDVGGGGGGAPAVVHWTPTPGATTATPSARALAKSKGLDLAGVRGTGNFGRVTKADVEAALGIAKKGKEVVVVAEDEPLSGPVEMTGMQKAIAKNMEATLSVPVFRVTKQIETDAFDALYQKLKPDGVTVSALLAKAVALALRKHPLLNAKYEPGAIVYNPNVNVAQAVALDGGLVTPTLKDADKMSLADLSVAWKDLVKKAKAKSLTPDEYSTGERRRFFCGDRCASLPCRPWFCLKNKHVRRGAAAVAMVNWRVLLAVSARSPSRRHVYHLEPRHVRRRTVRRHPAARPGGHPRRRFLQTDGRRHAPGRPRRRRQEVDDAHHHLRPPHRVGGRRRRLPQRPPAPRRETQAAGQIINETSGERQAASLNSPPASRAWADRKSRADRAGRTRPRAPRRPL